MYKGWVYKGEDYDPQPDWGQDEPQASEPEQDWSDAMVIVVDFDDGSGEDYTSPEWVDALARCGLEPKDVI